MYGIDCVSPQYKPTLDQLACYAAEASGKTVRMGKVISDTYDPYNYAICIESIIILKVQSVFNSIEAKNFCH